MTSPATSASLVLGSFQLIDPSGIQGFETGVLADGLSRGAPVPIDVAVKTWLQDGSIVVTQGYDNRDVTMRVRLHGTTLTSLADAEAALFAELGKPNLLTWTPPGRSAPASVFVVITSSLSAEDDDTGEAQPYPWRTYNLRLTCKAFVRSVDEITVTAPHVSGSSATSVDTMASATGWTATVNGAGASVTHAAGPPTTNAVTQSAAYGDKTLVMTKTVSLVTTSLDHLMVDWKPSAVPGGTSGVLTATGDGVALERLSSTPALTAGFTRTTFLVDAAALTVLSLSWNSDQPSTSPVDAVARTLTLDAISVSDEVPYLGSIRQQVRTVDVSGSAPRAEAALSVEASSTDALGDALIYVYPDGAHEQGYVPALRGYRSAGGTVTTDTGRVSGAYENLSLSDVTFEVPVTRVPRGLALLMVRVLTSSVADLVWTAATTLGGVDLAEVTGTFELPNTGGSDWANVAVGRLMVPTKDVPDVSDAVLTINLALTGGVILDEVWLFSTAGQLTTVACGPGTASTGGPANRVWLEPASVATPRPTLRIGHAADGSDSFYPAEAFWQPPVLTPPSVTVFTSTSDAVTADLKLRYFPTWHTHAGL